MAICKHLLHSHSSPVMDLWHILFGLLLFVGTISIIVTVMVGGSAERRGKGIRDIGRRSDMDAMEDEAGIKRTEEGAERERKEWVSKLQKRKFTCERQVDAASLGSHPIVHAIRTEGLDFFFQSVAGYRKNMVITFYANVRVVSNERKLVSEVYGVPVEVSPDSIAHYLGYRRPAPYAITHPNRGTPRDMNSIVQSMIEDAGAYNPVSGKLIAGGLTENYRLLNKIVHYNLSPHSIKKTPSIGDAELLYVFSSSTDVCDWAEFIYNEI